MSCLLQLDLWLGGPIGPDCITCMDSTPILHYVVSHQQRETQKNGIMSIDCLMLAYT